MDALWLPLLVVLALFALVATLSAPFLVVLALLAELTGDAKTIEHPSPARPRSYTIVGLIIVACVVGVAFLPLLGALADGLAGCDQANCDDPQRWDWMITVALAVPLYWFAFRSSRIRDISKPSGRQFGIWVLVVVATMIGLSTMAQWRGEVVLRATGHVLSQDRLAQSVVYAMIVLLPPAVVAWHRWRRNDGLLVRWLVILGPLMVVSAVWGWFATVGVQDRLPDEGVLHGRITEPRGAPFDNGQIRFIPDDDLHDFVGQLFIAQWPDALGEPFVADRPIRSVTILFEYVEDRPGGVWRPEIRVREVRDR